MKKEWKEQKQLLKQGIGALSLSTGYTLWVPFVISARLGGAKASIGVQLTGAFLLAAGVALLAWGFKVKNWKEWMKLFLFFGFLQLCLSFASGLLALLVLSLSGDNGKIAKEATDLCSAALAIPLHAWMLCLFGYLLKRGRFAFWFPKKLFLEFFLLCLLAAFGQVFLSWLPKNTGGILAQGLLGGAILFGILYWMQKRTARELSDDQVQEEGGN